MAFGLAYSSKQTSSGNPSTVRVCNHKIWAGQTKSIVRVWGGIEIETFMVLVAVAASSENIHIDFMYHLWRRDLDPSPFSSWSSSSSTHSCVLWIKKLKLESESKRKIMN